MPSEHETIFTMEATPVKFGRGASAEAGWELRRLGVRRAMLVTDPGVAALGHPERIKGLIEAEGIEVVLYERARVEPTIESFQDAVEFALEHEVDGFVSVGGGSSIDTAKVANLASTHPAPVMDYVNPPVGAGKKPPSPLKPHLAIPTTSGTGSEATTVAVLDIPDLKVKTGISHRYLRPAQAIVDPDLSRSLAPEVTSSTGLDVVCHAAESFLSKPFEARARPESPDDRPPYQGSNPVADVWSAKALEFGGLYLRRAVADGDDIEARGFMMLAATMAGVGFGSAGVHIPHACAYPIASAQARVSARRLPGRPSVRAARPLSDRHRARRVPVYLRRDARAPRARGRVARRRADRRSRPGHAPGRPAPAHAETSRRPAVWPSSGTPRTTSPTSSPARSSSSDCSR